MKRTLAALAASLGVCSALRARRRLRPSERPMAIRRDHLRLAADDRRQHDVPRRHRQQHRYRRRYDPLPPQVHVHGRIRGAQGPVGRVHRPHLSQCRRLEIGHARRHPRRRPASRRRNRGFQPGHQDHDLDDCGRIPRCYGSNSECRCAGRGSPCRPEAVAGMEFQRRSGPLQSQPQRQQGGQRQQMGRDRRREGPDRHSGCREWFVPWYVDVGTGQTDLTWQAIGGLGYSFKWGEVIGVWRYMDYNFKSGAPIEKLTLNGPAIGVAFHW